MSKSIVVTIAAVMLWAGSVFVLAQDASSLAAPKTTIWDGVFDRAQVARGEAVFNTSCVRCHALDAQGVPARMSGEAFWNNWADDPLGVMYTRIKTGMPNNAPDSLPPQSYADVVAFILSANGVPAAEGHELTPDAVSHIQMLRRDGPRPVPPGALVAIAGCLTQNGSAWTIESASQPLRSRTHDITADMADAERLTPAGKSYALKFPLLPLTPMRGQQVLARGLLLRDPDGLNIEAVRPLGRACAN